jgi:hypothetical protein
MNLSELTRTERTAHVDLSTPCQLTDKNISSAHRHALIDFLGIKPDRTWSACHLCKNHSKSGKPCRNPLHLYWGKQSENVRDVCPTTGLTSAEKTGEALKGNSWNVGKTQSDEWKANNAASRTGKKRGPYKKKEKNNVNEI